MITNKKSAKELRKFGYIISGPLLILTALIALKQNNIYYPLLGLAVFFIVSATFTPSILGPVEFLWMKFAGILSWVSTRIILILTFYLVITPMGFTLRLFGKDLLKRAPNRKISSYWEPIEMDGPCSRADKPY